MAAWTTDDVTALEKAIAQGALLVRYGDKSVQYRSLDEMLRLLDLMRKETGETTGSQSRKFASFSKGLE